MVQWRRQKKKVLKTVAVIYAKCYGKERILRGGARKDSSFGAPPSADWVR